MVPSRSLRDGVLVLTVMPRTGSRAVPPRPIAPIFTPVTVMPGLVAGDRQACPERAVAAVAGAALNAARQYVEQKQ
ncbi:MAG: hypothetical protein NFCOHLIN_02152 [Gammaproteobacteria bacterium]|nr:hypothetical protein [Gammaproteobacteria bacterium]